MQCEPPSDHLVTTSFEVWSEGYIVNGGRDGAKLWDIVEAESFEKACDIIFIPLDVKYPGYYKKDPLSFWGCQLFDNEVDARRSFG